MGRMTGRVAIVTGGTRGIGRAIALRLAQEGADIGITYSRSTEDAERVALDIGLLGPRCLVFKCDMGGEREQIAEAVKTIAEVFGGQVDVLVNSAARGLERPRPLSEQMPKHLHHAMDVSYFGALFAVQEAAKYMQPGAHIINLLSLGSERVLPLYGAVGIPKAALQLMTAYLGVELAPKGIIVNAISAGLVEGTDGYAIISKMGETGRIQGVPSTTPLGRNVTPDDIATTVLTIVTGGLPMMVGQTVYLDGGYSLQGWGE